VSNKSKKHKIEQDYKDYTSDIERKAQDEIKKIKEKIVQLKKEAEKIGQTIEYEADQNQPEKEEKS
jgi:hypothetical protein